MPIVLPNGSSGHSLLLLESRTNAYWCLEEFPGNYKSGLNSVFDDNSSWRYLTQGIEGIFLSLLSNSMELDDQKNFCCSDLNCVWTNFQQLFRCCLVLSFGRNRFVLHQLVLPRSRAFRRTSRWRSNRFWNCRPPTSFVSTPVAVIINVPQWSPLYRSPPMTPILLYP